MAQDIPFNPAITINSDKNECEAGDSKCSIHAKCINTVGSHKCECRAGFTGNGNVCYDIDECEKGQHNCTKPNTKCINTPGGFKCGCVAGYQGNYAGGCFDKNECADGTAVCALGSTCVNRPGSYECQCAPGLIANGALCEGKCHNF